MSGGERNQGEIQFGEDLEGMSAEGRRRGLATAGVGVGTSVWEALCLRCLMDVSAETSSWAVALWLWSSEGRAGRALDGRDCLVPGRESHGWPTGRDSDLGLVFVSPHSRSPVFFLLQTTSQVRGIQNQTAPGPSPMQPAPPPGPSSREGTVCLPAVRGPRRTRGCHSS